MAQPKSFGLNNQIAKDSENFQPESGRYHLYLAHSCPFCLRTHIALRLKGLQDHISISAAHPVTQKTKPDVDDHAGFVFRNETDEPLKTVAGLGSFPCKGCIPDTLNNCKSARELYEISGNAPTTYSLPVLWDKKNKTIVNNESVPIMRILSSAFNDIAKNPGLDLYPEALRDKINETNDFVDKEVNARIFKCGRAQNQQEYEENVNGLFAALDKAEDILSKNRYLCGGQFTESDIRLFALLVRFDETFYINFKCNKKRILDYPNLLNYCREIYQFPGVAETINMDHIKMSVYNMIPVLNPYAIIPAGPNFVGSLQEKHNRDSL